MIGEPVNELVAGSPQDPFFFTRDNKLYRYDPVTKKEELIREESGKISLLTGGDLTLYYLCGNTVVRVYPPTGDAQTVITFQKGQRPDWMKAADNKTLDFSIPTPQYLEWRKTHEAGDMLPASMESQKSYRYDAQFGKIYRTYENVTDQVAVNCIQEDQTDPKDYETYMNEYYDLSH